MGCTKLAENITGNDCNKPLVTGVDDQIILMNWDDIDRTLSTIDPTNKFLMTNLVMKATKKGYSATGFNMSNDYDIAMVPGTYIDGYDHNLFYRIFDISAATKLWIDNLKNSRVVAIVKNRVSSGNGAAKYEVLGWDHGLKVTELTRNQKDADTKGGYVLKLAADDQNKESKMPLTLFKTDEATTDALVASLYTV